MENVSLVQVLWALGVAALILFAVKNGRKNRLKKDAEKFSGTSGQYASNKLKKKGGGNLKVRFRAKQITAVNRENGEEINFYEPRHSQSEDMKYEKTTFSLYYIQAGERIHMSATQPTMEQAREILKANMETVIAIGYMLVNTERMLIATTPLECSHDEYMYFTDWELKVGT